MATDKRAHEKEITGAASVVGAATVLSRVLGYARDAVIAFSFGAGLYSDAFFMAFRIANLLRRLVGEGALTSSFIPIFTEELNRRDKRQTRALVSSVFSFFVIALVILTVLGIIFSKEFVLYMSPGFASDPQKFSLTVRLTQLMFPYMIFIGLTAVAMGVLNSYKHFTAPALSPVFLSTSIMLSVLALSPFLRIPVYSIAIGVLIGGVLQLLLQAPFLMKYGMMPRFTLNFRDPALKKILALMGPRTFGVGVYQLNLLVTMWFSSQLSEGAVSYLYYAGRLMEMPIGIFGVSVATAALPTLSGHAALKDWENFKGSLSFAVRIINFITIPATVGLFVLSYPVTEILFRRGEFNVAAASATSVALYYYALGLAPVSLARMLTSVFYSLKDTVTPVWTALLSFTVNIVLCFVLVGPLKHGGLALAASLSAVVDAAALLIMLKLRLGRLGGRDILDSALRSTVASLVMGAVIYLLAFKTFAPHGLVSRAALLAFTLATGLLTYAVMARLLKVRELSFLKGVLRR